MSKRQNQPGGGSGGGGDDDDTTKASTELSVHTTTAERGYEKEQLQDLNERFARYLEEVYFLTFFNKKLTSDVGFYKTKVERLEAVLRAVYEEELRQAKEVVEECREEAGRLGAKSERLENDAADLRERHAILVEGHDDDLQRLLSLEETLAEKTGIMVALQRKIHLLDPELQRLKRLAKTLRDLIADNKERTAEEQALRGQLEVNIPALEEEIAAQMKAHEQELRDVLDSLMRDVAPDYRDMFHSELQNALRDIRQEYSEQTERGSSRGEFLQTRIHEIIRTTTKKSQEEVVLKDNVAKDKIREMELSREIINLHGKGDHFRRRIEELERLQKKGREEFEDDIKDRDERMETLKSKMEEMLSEMQRMLDEKLRMDEEIATYRQLLSGEEKWIQDAMSDQSGLEQQQQQQQPQQQNIKY